jgi:hypothetical protein
MNAKYETLDAYLDDLDAIKEKVAKKTRGMTAKQAKDYFAGAARRLHELTGIKLRLRGGRRKRSIARG